MSVVERCTFTHDEARRTRQGVEYVDHYKIRLTDTASTERAAAQIERAGVLPSRWDQHPVYEHAYVDTINIRPQKDEKALRHYVAEVTYNTPTFERLAHSSDPLDQPAEIAWDSVARRVIVYEDKDGLPIRNSAGDWFDPPIEEERNYPRVTITRNESEYDPDVAQDYRDAVNSDAVRIAGFDVAARQALIKSYDGTWRQQDGDEYYRVRYVIEFKPGNGWIAEPVDQGFYAYNASGNKGRIVERQPADANTVGRGQGHPVDEPVRLDGTGHILGKNAPLSATVFGTFYTRKEREFWRLLLPTEMPHNA